MLPNGLRNHSEFNGGFENEEICRLDDRSRDGSVYLHSRRFHFGIASSCLGEWEDILNTNTKQQHTAHRKPNMTAKS